MSFSRCHPAGLWDCIAVWSLTATRVHSQMIGSSSTDACDESRSTGISCSVIPVAFTLHVSSAELDRARAAFVIELLFLFHWRSFIEQRSCGLNSTAQMLGCSSSPFRFVHSLHFPVFMHRRCVYGEAFQPFEIMSPSCSHDSKDVCWRLVSSETSHVSLEAEKDWSLGGPMDYASVPSLMLSMMVG